MYAGPNGLSPRKLESYSLWSALGNAAERFLDTFFPRTAAGFGDLDQTVALTTGYVFLNCLSRLLGE